MKKLIENKGITLITLCVTIVLLIIFSVISINLVISSGKGIFDASNKAAEAYKVSLYKDYIDLTILEINQRQELKQKEKIEKLNIMIDVLKKADYFEGATYRIQKYEKDDCLVIITKEKYVFVVENEGSRYIEKLKQLDGFELLNSDIEFIYDKTYTTQKIILEIKIIREEYKDFKIEYSYDMKDWKFLNKDGKLEIENNNTIVYARITNEIITSKNILFTKITNIDREKPNITSLEFGSIKWENTIGKITITGKAKDDESGIKAYQFSKDSKLVEDSTGWIDIETTTEEIVKNQEIIESGTYYFYVKDAVGNISKTSKDIVIAEKVKPKIELNASEENWTNQDVVLTAIAQDSESGIIGCAWTDNENEPIKWENINKTVSTVNKTYTASSNMTKYFWVKDANGNVNVDSIIIDKIDKIPPSTPTIKITDISVTASGWRYTISVSGGNNQNSKIKNYEYKIGSEIFSENSTTKTITGTSNPNYTIKVRTQDNARNYSAYSNEMTLNIERLYIRQLYQALRSSGAGAESEIDGWEQNSNYVTGAKIAYGILSSNEAGILYKNIGKQAMVERLYRGILGRNPDEGGLQNYMNMMTSDNWEEIQKSILTSIVNSPEAQNIYSTRGIPTGIIQ